MSNFKPGDLVVPVKIFNGQQHALVTSGFILGEIKKYNAALADKHSAFVDVYVTVIALGTHHWTVGVCYGLLADRFEKLV